MFENITKPTFFSQWVLNHFFLGFIFQTIHDYGLKFQMGFWMQGPNTWQMSGNISNRDSFVRTQGKLNEEWSPKCDMVIILLSIFYRRHWAFYIRNNVKGRHRYFEILTPMSHSGFIFWTCPADVCVGDKYMRCTYSDFQSIILHVWIRWMLTQVQILFSWCIILNHMHGRPWLL